MVAWLSVLCEVDRGRGEAEVGESRGRKKMILMILMRQRRELRPRSALPNEGESKREQRRGNAANG